MAPTLRLAEVGEKLREGGCWDDLGAVRRLMPRGSTSDWRAAHEALTRLARQRAGLDFEEGTWLLAAQRAGVHARLGYGSFFEYIERLFGYSPRLTHDKLRVAGALNDLPRLARALRQGAAEDDGPGRRAIGGLSPAQSVTAAWSVLASDAIPRAAFASKESGSW